MKFNKLRLLIAGLVVLVFLGWCQFKKKPQSDGMIKIVQPVIGAIQKTVSTTGTVLPKNRLEIKPPVSGRIEQILVKEGEKVSVGQMIAWMSSTERAALLDAARGQGEDQLNYWQDVYKPIPLMAPIDGEVIVGTIQPGQTVTTADSVVVLSDRLIVRAQVDETDIGKIKEGQKAVVSLDAYPEQKINALVDHIYYESKTINNVTMYEVDLISEIVPDFFRSGMSASIEFIQESKSDILTLPINAVQKEKEGAFVTVVLGKKQQRREVKIGIADEKNIEIISGLVEADEVVIKAKKYSLPKAGASSPLTPQRRSR